MSVTVSDLLKLSKSMVNSMRERDVTVETSRRSARNILNRTESALDASDGGVKIVEKKLQSILSQPFPEVCAKNIEICQLCEDNRELALIAAEQHISMEMMMMKYREKVMQSSGSRKDYLVTQRCLNKHDGMLGVILHEKGVVLGVMEDSIWEDDDGDVGLVQHASKIVRENDVLRELLKSSYRSNGTNHLSAWSDEKGGQPQVPSKDSEYPEQSVSPGVINPGTWPAYDRAVSNFLRENPVACSGTTETVVGDAGDTLANTRDEKGESGVLQDVPEPVPVEPDIPSSVSSVAENSHNNPGLDRTDSHILDSDDVACSGVTKTCVRDAGEAVANSCEEGVEGAGLEKDEKTALEPTTVVPDFLSSVVDATPDDDHRISLEKSDGDLPDTVRPPDLLITEEPSETLVRDDTASVHSS